MIVIVMGLPGSGKSFFAHQVAGMIDAAYISSDRERKRVVQSEYYSEEAKSIVYDNILGQIAELRKTKTNIVIDATFYKSLLRDKFKNAFAGEQLFYIEVQADEAIIKERLQHKRSDSDADIGVYEKIKKQWEPFNGDHLVLQSTNENIQQMLQEAMKYLQMPYDKRTNQ